MNSKETNNFLKKMWTKDISRRKLLVAGVLSGAAVIFGSRRIGLPLAEEAIDWQATDRTEQDYIKERKEKIQHIYLGGSFSLERFNNLNPQNFKKENGEDSDNYAFAKKALKYIVEDVGIKKLRLGAWWNHTLEQKNGVQFFGFYKEIFDYCLENNVEICVNVGPIKTFQWPEEHVPSSVRGKKGGNPPSGTEIGPHDILATEGDAYLEKLLSFLKQNYGKIITGIEPDNEPFEEFGDPAWVMTPGYMEKKVSIIHAYFPDAQIVLSCSGRPRSVAHYLSYIKKFQFPKTTLDETVDFIESMVQKDPSYKNKFAVGINSYYETPASFPFNMHWAFGRQIDTLSQIQLFSGRNAIENLIKKSREIGFSIRIEELQDEPWDKSVDPGKTLQGLEYQIDRGAKVLDLEKKEKSYIGLWGLEYLAMIMLRGNPTKQQRERVKLIKDINQL